MYSMDFPLKLSYLFDRLVQKFLKRHYICYIRMCGMYHIKLRMNVQTKYEILILSPLQNNDICMSVVLHWSKPSHK